MYLQSDSQSDCCSRILNGTKSVGATKWFEQHLLLHFVKKYYLVKNMGKSRILNKTCTKPGGDCVIRNLPSRQRCDYHRSLYRHQNYIKNKKVVVQTNAGTTKDILTCSKCKKLENYKLYSPTCLRNYWKLTKQSKYNIP